MYDLGSKRPGPPTNSKKRPATERKTKTLVLLEQFKNSAILFKSNLSQFNNKRLKHEMPLLIKQFAFFNKINNNTRT